MGKELNFKINDCNNCLDNLKQDCSTISTYDWSVKLNHELGTPLGVALTSLTSLRQAVDENQNGNDGAKIEPYLDLSIQAIDKAIDKLQGFKDITQPEVSANELILVDDLLKVAVSLSEIKFPKKNIKCVVSCPSYLSIRSCDKVYSKIINNLVDNVFEHAFDHKDDKAELHINASFNVESGNLLFRLKDNGVGIDPKLIDLLQQPYVSIKKSNQSGLGLAEVHHLVTSVLGGQFSINSSGKDQGTCVKVCIPSTSMEDQKANTIKPIS
jgi:signal transduction histidine kinase